MKRLPIVLVLILFCTTLHAQYNQVSNLPCFYITTTDSVAITSKDEYVTGTLVVAGGTADHGYYNGKIQIRGRGNSTWKMAKKPYRIKLDSKYNLLGMPAKEKSWVLLANYADKSLMRNAIAFEISRFMGFTFTPSYRYADVYINGSYQGNYMVTEQIEVQKDRVNVEEQKVTDSSGAALTGGYLIEVDGFASSDPVWFKTKLGVPITIKYPDDKDINAQQKQYISQYVQQFEDALYSANFKDSLSGYRKYVDIRSLVDYYILSELTANSDCFWSTYLYKHRNDPKIYTGPVWDFDIAFDNDNRLGEEANKYMIDYAHAIKWYKQLLNDEYFYRQVKQRWTALKGAGLLGRVQKVSDSLTQLLQQSQALNFKKWPVLNKVVYLELAARGSYANETNFLKNFATNRFNWFDNELKGLDSNKVFIITSQKSGKVMDLSGRTATNARIVQQPAKAVLTQKWRFKNLNNGYYQIYSTSTAFSLTNGSSTVRGAQLQASASDPHIESQQWRIINIGGKYALINRSTGQAADLSGSSTADGTPVIQWDNSVYTKPNQQWTFNPPVAAPSAAQSVATPVKIYPNPVNGHGQVSVEIDLKAGSRIYVSIYNAQGILEKSVDEGQQFSGHLQLPVSINGLLPGNYTVVIKGDTEKFNGQLLIR